MTSPGLCGRRSYRVSRIGCNDGMLQPDAETRAEWTKAVVALVDEFIEGLEAAPASSPSAAVLPPPPRETPSELRDLLAQFADAAAQAVETAGPRYLAYFPAGGLYSSVLAEFLAQTVNRYTGVASTAPALVALEQSVIRWLCDEFGLPEGSGGLLTTGASLATLSAVHAARQSKLGAHDPAGTIYVTAHTHHCVAKAAQITGFAADRLRVVPGLRMDVAAAREMIAADREAGLRPFLVVGTAGSTSTGTIDPLAEIADLAVEEGLWFHVDGAYGGAPSSWSSAAGCCSTGYPARTRSRSTRTRRCSCRTARVRCWCGRRRGCGPRTWPTPTTSRTSTTARACPTMPTWGRS